MSNTLTLVGKTKSFLRIETFPDFSFLTDEILTINFFGVISNILGVGYPV